MRLRADLDPLLFGSGCTVKGTRFEYDVPRGLSRRLGGPIFQSLVRSQTTQSQDFHTVWNRLPATHGGVHRLILSRPLYACPWQFRGFRAGHRAERLDKRDLLADKAPEVYIHTNPLHRIQPGSRLLIRYPQNDSLPRTRPRFAA